LRFAEHSLCVAKGSNRVAARREKASPAGENMGDKQFRRKSGAFFK
jgi:hypothetical protein